MPTRSRKKTSAGIPAGDSTSAGSGGSITATPSSSGAPSVRASSTVSRGRASRAARAGSGTVFQRRRRPPLLVRRFVLLGLVALSVLLLTLSYRGGSAGGPLHGAQMQVLAAVAPIERGMTRAWEPIAGSYSWVTRLFSASTQNPRLRERMDELEAELASSKELADENARLREVLDVQERGRFPEGFKKVTGTVISRSPSAVERSVVIDVGSNDGVRIDDPVMVARGLIGRVEAVSVNAARVSLIINRTQAVSAAVVGSDASGVVRAVTTEGSPVMELAYVSQRVKVTRGDLVVTSGWSTGELESIFPRGIPVGVVSSVGNSPADLYKTVQVTPFASFDRIDHVIVLAARERETIVAPERPAAAPRTPAKAGG